MHEHHGVALQVAIWGTFVLYWITMVVYCAVPSTEQYHVMDRCVAHLPQGKCPPHCKEPGRGASAFLGEVPTAV